MIQLLLNTIVFDLIFVVDAYINLEVTFHEFSDEKRIREELLKFYPHVTVRF
jgi:hypothetical protein